MPSAIPSVGPGRRLRAVVGQAADPVRRTPRHPVALAIAGPRHGQGALGGAATGPNPIDRGKLGTKRHTLTDQSGAPLAVVVTGANCHDMKRRRPPWTASPSGDPGRRTSTLSTCASIKGTTSRGSRRQSRCDITPHISAIRRMRPAASRHPARRWVVERTRRMAQSIPETPHPLLRSGWRTIAAWYISHALLLFTA